MLSEQAIAEKAAQTLLENDTATRWLGMSLKEVYPGEARLIMTITQQMLNGHETCHGGIIFSLADSAFAVACNSYNKVAVAASASIEFMAPAKLNDQISAHASVRSQGGRTGVYDVTVRNQAGKNIALFRGRAYRLGQSLFDESDHHK